MVTGALMVRWDLSKTLWNQFGKQVLIEEMRNRSIDQTQPMSYVQVFNLLRDGEATTLSTTSSDVRGTLGLLGWEQS